MQRRAFKWIVSAGRLALLLSITSLLGAWIVQVTKLPLLGVGQQHLFMDAIALAAIAIACFVDGILHAKQL